MWLGSKSSAKGFDEHEVAKAEVEESQWMMQVAGINIGADDSKGSTFDLGARNLGRRTWLLGHPGILDVLGPLALFDSRAG